jgi:hypothetical protein
VELGGYLAVGEPACDEVSYVSLTAGKVALRFDGRWELKYGACGRIGLLIGERIPRPSLASWLFPLRTLLPITPRLSGIGRQSIAVHAVLRSPPLWASGLGEARSPVGSIFRAAGCDRCVLEGIYVYPEPSLGAQQKLLAADTQVVRSDLWVAMEAPVRTEARVWAPPPRGSRDRIDRLS